MHGRQQIVADRADRRILAHILTAHWTRSVAADVSAPPRPRTSGSRSYGHPVADHTARHLTMVSHLTTASGCRRSLQLNSVAAWKISLGGASRTPGRSPSRSRAPCLSTGLAPTA